MASKIGLVLIGLIPIIFSFAANARADIKVVQTHSLGAGGLEDFECAIYIRPDGTLERTDTFRHGTLSDTEIYDKIHHEYYLIDYWGHSRTRRLWPDTSSSKIPADQSRLIKTGKSKRILGFICRQYFVITHPLGLDFTATDEVWVANGSPGIADISALGSIYNKLGGLILEMKSSASDPSVGGSSMKTISISYESRTSAFYRVK